MATIHFILQGKGGVGKSMIAVFLYQYLKEKGIPVDAYDTDPVNHTLASFKEFNVVKIDLMGDGEIDVRKFDDLMEGLITTPDNGHAIVDNGASTFVALGAYLQDNDFLGILGEHGHQVLFHTVITGGQALSDTIQGFKNLAETFISNTGKIILWLNPYFGEISVENGSKNFEDFTVYKEYSSRVQAIIELPPCNKSTIGRDLAELLASRQSFHAGINASYNHCMVRSRLKRYWSDIQECIAKARLV